MYFRENVIKMQNQPTLISVDTDCAYVYSSSALASSLHRLQDQLCLPSVLRLIFDGVSLLALE